MKHGNNGKFISENKLKSHKCEICGKEFLSYKNEARFCSRGCYKEIGNSAQCSYCGKIFKRGPFSLSGKKFVFCSMECYRKWRFADNKAYIICQVCGKKKRVGPYAVRHGRTVCSVQCSGILRRKGRWGKCLGCGKDIYIMKSEEGRKKFCSNKCKAEHQGEYLRGLNVGSSHPNWKGGKTPTRIKLIQSGEYSRWRISVYEKDNYACRACDDISGSNLVAHHIESFTDNPDLRLSVDNGITLCKECHKEFHKKYTTHHNNREQLVEFLNAKNKTTHDKTIKK